VKFPATLLPLSDTGPTQEECHPPYLKFERRAAVIMGGWAHVQGDSPDDLASEALRAYLGLVDEYGEEDAHKLASRAMQQDVFHLYQKEKNNPTTEFEHPSWGEGDDTESDVEYSLAAWEHTQIYFSADQLDWMSDLLTGPELEAVVLVYEEDVTQLTAAKRMGVSQQRVSKILQSAHSKLQIHLKDTRR